MASPSRRSLSKAAITFMAVVRLVLGGGTLLLPQTVLSQMGYPMSPDTVPLARLFAIREFVLGALLWVSPTPPDAALKSAGSYGVGAGELKRLLWAGVVVDAVEICSCTIAAFDGTMQGFSIRMGVGGALLGITMGLLGISGL